MNSQQLHNIDQSWQLCIQGEFYNGPLSLHLSFPNLVLLSTISLVARLRISSGTFHLMPSRSVSLSPLLLPASHIPCTSRQRGPVQLPFTQTSYDGADCVSFGTMKSISTVLLSTLPLPYLQSPALHQNTVASGESCAK